MTAPATPAPAILYVDDEATALKYFQRALGSLAQVITAESVDEGKRLLAAHAATLTVLVSDQRMPGANGNELLLYAAEHHPHVVRILTTAYSELEHTVEAVNQGQIHRYIQKPWDIAALRMEIRQALELVALRHDHALLLREKLQVRQQHTLAHRIGLLHALCAPLNPAAPFAAVAATLDAAQRIGLAPAEPDWVLMDFADLVAAEACRGAELALALDARLRQLEQRCPGDEPEQALLLLSEQFDGRFRRDGAGGTFLQPRALAAFLEARAGAALPADQVAWLAVLLWLGRRGHTLQLDSDQGDHGPGRPGHTLQLDGDQAGNGAAALRCRLAPATAGFSQDQLAAWIEQF